MLPSVHSILSLLFGFGFFQINLFRFVVIVVVIALLILGVNGIRWNISEEVVSGVDKNFVSDGSANLNPDEPYYNACSQVNLHQTDPKLAQRS